MKHDELVKAVGDRVLADLRDRKGIRQAFDLIDDDIIEEIRNAVGGAALDAIDASGIAWVAPWEATEAMRRPRPFPTEWNEYRDAYLAEQGDGDEA